MQSFFFALLGAVVVDAGAGLLWAPREPRPEDVRQLAERAVPLSPHARYQREDYRFLDRAIGAASVVQLGESLHITDEFPRIRLRMIEYLHEQLGFDTLALEGSLTQAWLAEEHLYRSQDPARVTVARAQELAWFRLWRTEPMRELMAYVYETQHTPTPLYLTSFDVEIGASSAFGNGEDVVSTLFAALHAYAPPPHADAAREATWHDALRAVVDCKPDGERFAGRSEALAAIDELEVWIDAIAPRVAAERPAAHAIAMRMIPQNFRDNVDLCTRAPQLGWQAARDQLNATNALALRDRLSATHKIILWAHHSHVAYDSTGRNIVSMGELLHAQPPGELYTIGLFAGGGRVIATDVFGERELASTRRFGVERLLAAVGRGDYFVDLKSLPTSDPQAGWLVPDSSRLETIARRPTVLARDFDGAVFVAQVHPAAFDPSRAMRWLLRALGFVEQHFVGFGLLLLAGLAQLIGVGVGRLRRWSLAWKNRRRREYNEER